MALNRDGNSRMRAIWARARVMDILPFFLSFFLSAKEARRNKRRERRKEHKKRKKRKEREEQRERKERRKKERKETCVRPHPPANQKKILFACFGLPPLGQIWRRHC